MLVNPNFNSVGYLERGRLARPATKMVALRP